MKNMGIQDRRLIAPNVKMVSSEVFRQFVAWFRAGIGLGLMLFTALTTFSVLSHGAKWVEGSAKQGQLREQGQGGSPVLAKTDYVMPVRVSRGTAVAQKSQDDYRMFHEQARLVTDLTNSLSRTLSSLAK